MCITSRDAKLSKTRILSMELDNGRHLLSYSNKVDNNSGQKNSMILAIPGIVKEEWFYDTTNYNKFLEDIEDQAHLSYDESKGIYSRGFLGINSKGLNKFDIGMYTIFLAKRIEDLQEAGVGLTQELINFFNNTYKGWSIVACIFDGNKQMESQPIMFEYEPTHPEWLYFPTMDSHDGGAPRLDHKVQMGHSLMYEYPGLIDRVVQNLNFSQDAPEILRRRNYVSTKWQNRELNGDMYLHLPSLKKRVDNKEFCYDGFNRLAKHPGLTKVLA